MMRNSAAGKVSAQTRIRVRYAETDQMGVVYHANYLIWFEVGRVELMRQYGFDYKQMELEDDCHIVVVEAYCRYRSPARYDDQLIVTTHIAELRGFLLKFGYSITRESDSTVLCDGQTTHVITDRKFKRRSFPAKYTDTFRALIEPDAPPS